MAETTTVRKKRSGQHVYVCARTGLAYPPDYVEQWGIKYGVGFGPTPISESLVNDYWLPVVGEGDKAMHPLSVSRSQVDKLTMSEEEYAEYAAIIAGDDPDIIHRGGLMKIKQIIKSQTMRQKFPEIAIDADKQLFDLMEKNKVKAYSRIKTF